MTLSFDSLDLRQTEVTIQGKPYLLREASGGGAARWRGAVIKAARFGSDGKVERLDGAADAEIILVNECLVDSSGRRTPVQILQGWPARVVKALFEEAKRISELDEPEASLEDQEKALEEKLAAVRLKRRQGEKLDPTLPAGSDLPVTCGFPSDGSSEPPPNGS